MENNNETPNSQNGETENQDSPNLENGGQENLDPTALKKKLDEVSETNRQLFARAKKAEGFEFKDGEWVKPSKSEEKKPGRPPKKSDDLDYGQKAYLKASGIEPTEFEFVKQEMESSGKDIDELLENGYFQNSLKSFREAKAVAKATPGATRTASEPASSKVDYWIAKGELPPDPKLRIEVVNKKIELARSAQNR